MIVTCGNCKKRYKIDPRKLRGKTVRVACAVCKHYMTISSPVMIVPDPLPEYVSASEEPVPPQPKADPQPENDQRADASASVVAIAPPARQKRAGISPGKTPSTAGSIDTPPVKWGLTPKLVLFLLLPLAALYLINAYLTLLQAKNAHHLTIAESRTMCERMGEKYIIAHARSIAAQTRLYLWGHPNLTVSALSKDIDFERIVVQPVGLTGSSFLLEKPSPNGGWHIRMHADRRFVGDLEQHESGSDPVSSDYRSIIAQAAEGIESQGYYTTIDRDGSHHRVFLVCTPVAGTPLVIASGTRIEEFTLPVSRMENRILQHHADLRRIQAATAGLGLIAVLALALWYGRRLRRRIVQLTRAATHLGMGSWSGELGRLPKDELGVLGRVLVVLHDRLRRIADRSPAMKKRA